MKQPSYLMNAEELIGYRRVDAVAAHPDGAWLAVQVQRLDEEKGKYVKDLWRVPVGDGEPVQLTSGEHNDTAPAFRHDGALLFMSNRPTPEDDEGKRSQVWVFRNEGGDPVPLTDEPLGVSGFAVASDADVMVVKTSLLPDVADDEQRKTAKERAEKGPTAVRYDSMPVRFWDHWLPNEETHFVAYRKGERKPWFGDHSYRNANFDLSPDGRYFAVSRRVDLGEDRLRDEAVELWEIESFERRATEQEDHVWYFQPVFGDDILYLHRSERVREHAPRTDIVRWDWEEGTIDWICRELDDGRSVVDVAPDGRLVATGDLQGTTPVFTIDPADGSITRITSTEAAGSHSGVSTFARDGEPWVCGVRSTLLDAPEPFVVKLEADARPTVPHRVSGWEGADGVRVEEARASSTDGADVHYYLVGPDDDEERPTLLWIHGGPIASWGDIWHWRWNSLVAVAAGYRVILPNPRGSTGYGFEFLNGIWGNVWGAQCFEDLMAVTDDVEIRPDVDPEKIVAMGGSFGGYMTNWIGGMTDRYACLVSHAGIASFETFHGITDNPAWWSLMFGMDPFEDLQDLRLYSPLSRVPEWSSPVLVIHGQQDYRVPVGEALVLFEALQKYGVDSELLVFPDENHWILRPNNVVAWYTEVLEFIGRHVE